ncbi:hypothetical protein P8452_66439 [Trifolium repens]|nr:hypothetical protein P8452_66439 [Trifolium repens]
MKNLLKNRKDFIGYVNIRLARFWKQRLAIKEFNLSVDCFELGYMSNDVDLWLKLASESSVESVIEAKSLTNMKSLSMHGLQKLKIDT